MKELKECCAQLRSEFLSKRNYPTDKDIAIVADMIYRKDREDNDSDKSDIEMLGVMRGIEQGMKLMRQILETDGN